MFEWWGSLTTLQKFFYYCAVPSTFLLIIQTTLSLIGIGNDSDVDIDFDGDTDFDGSLDIGEMDSVSDFRFITIRGIIAFLTMFGWVGAALSKSNLNTGIIILIAFLSGLLSMTIIGGLFYGISKLQSSGNINYRNAVGCVGEVYIPIPSKRKGMGKIQLSVQERIIEMDAMTDEDKILQTGAMVQVIDIHSNHVVIVKKHTT